MCSIWKNSCTNDLELSSLDLRKSLDAPIKGASITGGEPFLRDDLLDIVEVLPSEKVFISTNGTLINRVSDLIRNTSKSLGFGVSIDGMEETHNLQRGVRSYNLVINTIKLLKNKHIPVIISFTITPNNIGDINNVYSLSKDMGCGFAMRPAQNSPYFGGTKNKFSEHDICLLQEELNALKSRWRENYLPSYMVFNIINYMSGKIRLPPCYALKDSIIIGETGDVYACPDLVNISLGNLKERTLSEILSSEEAICMREKIKQLDCPGCWSDCNTLNNLNHTTYHGLIKYPARAASLILPPRLWNNVLFH